MLVKMARPRLSLSSMSPPRPRLPASDVHTVAPVAPCKANADAAVGAPPASWVSLEKMTRLPAVRLGGVKKLTRLPPAPQIGPASRGPQRTAPVAPL
jgi:hypothetical protein